MMIRNRIFLHDGFTVHRDLLFRRAWPMRPCPHDDPDVFLADAGRLEPPQDRDEDPPFPSIRDRPCDVRDRHCNRQLFGRFAFLLNGFFEAGSPWFGWGVGAGNAIIPPDSALALAMQTYAAHNEYLRTEVEGGQIGLALLIAMFVLWVAWHTSRLRRTDKLIMRLAFLAFAAHAYTDNVLIATTACIFFAFATAVFADKLAERGQGGVARANRHRSCAACD